MALAPLPHVTKEELLHRIACEYLEMPALRLTPAQAQRLFHLDAAICSELFHELVERGFLGRTQDGRYARATRGPVVFPVPRMTKARFVPTARNRKRA